MKEKILQWEKRSLKKLDKLLSEGKINNIEYKLGLAEIDREVTISSDVYLLKRMRKILGLEDIPNNKLVELVELDESLWNDENTDDVTINECINYVNDKKKYIRSEKTEIHKEVRDKNSQNKIIENTLSFIENQTGKRFNSLKEAQEYMLSLDMRKRLSCGGLNTE